MPVIHFSSFSEAVLELFVPSASVLQKRPVFGGDINRSFSLKLSDGQTAFLKTNHISALKNFQAEADGLQAIANTKTIRTPEVLGMGTDPEGYAFLFLSYIEGKHPSDGFWECFASQLYQMHSAKPSEENGFGFPDNNFIGLRKQDNTWNSSWISFFRKNRLECQFESASHYFTPGERKRIQYLLDHLEKYLQEPAKPALLHGDLWSGNFMTGEDGRAWLIDPAVYYGHPETDLAMTELFGGFSEAFYIIYKDLAHIDSGYEDRKDVYNLYHLLNHLNMFGEDYLPAVCRILRKYT